MPLFVPFVPHTLDALTRTFDRVFVYVYLAYSCVCTQGKNFKRARIGGRGRIKPYKKFGCHVFIKVEER